MIIVGERKDSQTYVRMKRRMCAEVGFVSFDKDMPGDTSEEDVLQAVKAFNEDPAVHGEVLENKGLIRPFSSVSLFARTTGFRQVRDMEVRFAGLWKGQGKDPLWSQEAETIFATGVI